MVPHQDFFDDLAIVYYYCLNGDERSILVRNSHTDIWGIDNDSEYLHTIALSNTRRLFPPRITSINQILSDIPGSTYDLSMEDNKFFVLTNEKGMYGAVSLLYDDVLAAACRQLGSSKIYLLTSSLHEVIILSADSVDGYKNLAPTALKGIIKDINTACVDQSDILGECVFSFTPGKKLVREA